MAEESRLDGTLCMEPIGKGKERDWSLYLERGWSVYLNGELVKNVSELTIENPNIGKLGYGDKGGYDGVNFHEIGGGGSVIIPFVEYARGTLIGVVEQKRPNQGGIVLNVPRGFLNPGEKHFEAAIRETKEETEFKKPEDRFFPIKGSPVNPNSAFFVTANDGEGVKFFGLKIFPEEVTNNNGEVVFRKEHIKPVSRAAEGIVKCKFIPYEDVIMLSDAFSIVGATRLLAHLTRND